MINFSFSEFALIESIKCHKIKSPKMLFLGQKCQRFWKLRKLGQIPIYIFTPPSAICGQISVSYYTARKTSFHKRKIPQKGLYSWDLSFLTKFGAFDPRSKPSKSAQFLEVVICHQKPKS